MVCSMMRSEMLVREDDLSGVLRVVFCSRPGVDAETLGRRGASVALCFFCRRKPGQHLRRELEQNAYDDDDNDLFIRSCSDGVNNKRHRVQR